MRSLVPVKSILKNLVNKTSVNKLNNLSFDFILSTTCCKNEFSKFRLLGEFLKNFEKIIW